MPLARARSKRKRIQFVSTGSVISQYHVSALLRRFRLPSDDSRFPLAACGALCSLPSSGPGETIWTKRYAR